MRDSDVRAAVLRSLHDRHAGDTDTRVVQEMGVWSGSVRIDIAVINGKLSGIELKSDSDTLERLPFQSEIYSRVFDSVELVVGSRHAIRATELVPNWWSITVAESGDGILELVPARIGEQNPSQDPMLIAQLLWKEEALEVLEAMNLARGWRSKRAKAIHERLAGELPLPVLLDRVRDRLKRRSAWLGQALSRPLDVAIDTDLDPSL